MSICCVPDTALVPEVVEIARESHTANKCLYYSIIIYFVGVCPGQSGT